MRSGRHAHRRVVAQRQHLPEERHRQLAQLLRVANVASRMLLKGFFAPPASSFWISPARITISPRTAYSALSTFGFSVSAVRELACTPFAAMLRARSPAAAGACVNLVNFASECPSTSIGASRWACTHPFPITFGRGL